MSVFPCLDSMSVFQQDNRKRSVIHDTLQPSCHPPGVRLQDLPLAGICTVVVLLEYKLLC